MEQESCVIILSFENDKVPLVYDLNNMPNIEPIQQMVKNFKSYKETVFESVRFKKYIITDCDKETVTLLIDIIGKKYNNITIDNIRKVIWNADFYGVEMDYSQISDKIINELLNNVTNDDSFVIAKLFSNKRITERHCTKDNLRYISSKINNMKELCDTCHKLYYDEDNNHAVVIDDFFWGFCDENDTVSATLIPLKYNKKLGQDYYLSKNTISKNIVTFTMMLNEGFEFVKCIFFNNKHVIKEIKFNDETNDNFGIWTYENQKMIFTLDTTFCTSMYFVYKGTSKE